MYFCSNHKTQQRVRDLRHTVHIIRFQTPQLTNVTIDWPQPFMGYHISVYLYSETDVIVLFSGDTENPWIILNTTFIFNIWKNEKIITMSFLSTAFHLFPKAKIQPYPYIIEQKAFCSHALWFSSGRLLNIKQTTLNVGFVKISI